MSELERELRLIIAGLELSNYKRELKGRASMKAEILAIINSCLVRDPTLQKLVIQIEDIGE